MKCLYPKSLDNLLILFSPIGDLIERLNQEGCRKARVLDLACGKGGDLRKWRIGNIGEIVMTGSSSK
jgi:hypothetical protein